MRSALLYIAHRGMNRRALENTIPAFRLARDHADGVELDVQLARCGTPVVFHDDTLEKIFGVPGVIADYTAQELGKLVPCPSDDFAIPYEGWKPSAQERVPRLEDVLDLFDADFLVNVEIKAPTLKWRTPTTAVARALASRRGNYLVSSFNPVELARFRGLNRQVPVALLYEPNSSLVLRQGWPAPVLGLGGLVAIHPNWKLVSADLVERAHARGWAVNVWTVNDPQRAAWLERDGVDGVISDAPDTLREPIREPCPVV